MGDLMEGAHRARVQRFGGARTRAVSNKGFLEANMTQYDRNYQGRLKKAWYGLRNCANWLEFHHYYTIDQYRLVNAILCKNRWLCPFCALRWSDHALAAYYAKHKVVQAQHPHLIPALLTLTVKPDPYLARVYGRLEDALRKVTYTMRQAKKRKDKSEFAKIKGMLGNVEVKKSSRQPDKWFPHFHAVVLLEDYIDKPALDKEWHQKTGNSWITGIQELDDPFKGFMEVMTYSLKSSTMPPRDQVEAFLTLRGKQTVRASGLYHGVKEPDPGLDTPLEELPYVKLLYRYSFEAQGYNLEDHEVVS